MGNGFGSDLLHASVTVDTTADGGEVICRGKSGRESLLVANLSDTVTVYVGGTGSAGTGLTTSNGFPIAPGESVSFDDFTGALYGIVASGSADVRYLQVF